MKLSMNPKIRVLLISVGLTTLLFLGGCKVTMEKVEKWKKNGDTTRLKKCLGDKEQKDTVRTAAGLALLDLGAYYAVEVTLKKVQKQQKKKAAALADAMAKKIAPNLKGTDEKAIKAKDALFSLWTFVSAENQKTIEKQLVGWLLEHYTLVATSGEHSAKKIFEALGPKAGQMVSELLSPTHGQIFQVANLVRKIASPADREKLVARLISAIKKNPRLQANPELIYAIGEICAKKSLKFLQSQVKSGYNYTVRRNAMIGLRQCPHPSSLAAAFGLLTTLVKKALADEYVSLPNFSQKDNKPGVILQAFEVVNSVKKWDAAKAGLKTLLTLDNEKELSEKNQKRKLLIRMMAGQYMVFLGKQKGLKMLLQNIPATDKYPKGYLAYPVIAIKRQYENKDRDKALAILRKALQSQNWVSRIIALESIRLLGNKETDVPLLKKLTGDKTVLKGWGSGTITLGERAELAINDLKNR
jgi:hypothetical protein